MTFRRYAALIIAIVVALSVCNLAVGAQETATMGPLMTAASPAKPDSAYALVKSRLVALAYRIDSTNVAARHLVVRAPHDETRVQIEIAARKKSSLLEVRAIGTGNTVVAMGSALNVLYDATTSAANRSRVGVPVDGALPKSQWRSATFLSPSGRLWSARGALFDADSLYGAWRLAFRFPEGDADAVELAVGTAVAFVDDDRVVIGTGGTRPESAKTHLYRTTDRGQHWSVIGMGELTSVSAIAAMDSSLWLFATRFEGDARLAAFRRSIDGGATWGDASLPRTFTDVDRVYRVTPSVAYVATEAYERRTPALWRTTDGGVSWDSVSTPRDEKLIDIPSYGSRIERIATVGNWLVVREYGQVFVRQADAMQWRRLADIKDVAADRECDRLFALTKHLEIEMLDHDLAVVWKSRERLSENDGNVEGMVATRGTVFVTTGNGAIYEARDAKLRVRRPTASP